MTSMRGILGEEEPHAPVRVLRPAARLSSLVFASPHSGRAYPQAFLAAAAAPLSVLRRSEDAYVDALFAAAPDHGAPLIVAQFPRALADPNRAPAELDPTMFTGAPAELSETVSSRAAAGLGVVPRLAADGRPIYRKRLPFDEVDRRLQRYYIPYHAALRAEIDAALALFGEVCVVDCHSMPAASARGADIVLGDRYGASCTRGFVARAEAHFRDLGFAVVRNRPYAGGYTTEHYGRPSQGVQALQIEINRGLYLEELSVRPSSGMKPLQRTLEEWIIRMSGECAPARVAAE